MRFFPKPGLVGYFLLLNSIFHLELPQLELKAVGFRGISRQGSAFFTLRWFKLAHIYTQVAVLHEGDESICKFLK